MSDEEILQYARRRRSVARALTDHDDFDGARAVLQALAKRLSTHLTSRRERAAASDASGTALARELLDTYGNLGGVEWRAGNLQQALHAYQAGRRIEEDERYGIEESYNLTNSIVLLVIMNPQDFESIRPQVAGAAEIVRTQLEGRRRDQWWAWADYGLLNLLLGDLATADGAYESFFECGPATSDFRSVWRVLNLVSEAVEPIDHIAVEHLQREAAFLQDRIEP